MSHSDRDVNGDYLRITDYPKNERNPFIENAIQQINNHTVTKRQYMVPTNGDVRRAIVNRDTGEIDGETAFLKMVKVDEEKFAKVFLTGFASWGEINASASKVFAYILNQLRPGSDRFIFRLDECQEQCGYKSRKPIFRGLANLLQLGIIARTKYEYEYFINPLVAFNGNRVTFATQYIRSRRREDNPDQLSMFGEEDNKRDKAIEDFIKRHEKGGVV